MITYRRPVLAAFLFCLLGLALSAQDDAPRKWSPWRPIDEHFNAVRIRTSYDDNEGRGWADGSHHWLIEVKNAGSKATMKVGLAFPHWNGRTRSWEPPAEELPPPFELEPGEVHEGSATGPEKEGFAYRYAIGVVDGDGKAKCVVTGLANSRIVPKPIKESSLVANAAFAKALAEEKKLSPGDSPAAPAPVVAPPAAVAVTRKPAPPAAPEAKPADTPPAPLSALPMNAPTLPPASVEGLDAAGKFALWSQRAQQGDAAAMFELGLACRYGQGTTQDHAAATEWYRQAALRGHAAAATKLGFAYNSGLGVERSETTAIEWWRKAAALGDPDAAKKLAQLGVAP